MNPRLCCSCLPTGRWSNGPCPQVCLSTLIDVHQTWWNCFTGKFYSYWLNGENHETFPTQIVWIIHVVIPISSLTAARCILFISQLIIHYLKVMNWSFRQIIKNNFKPNCLFVIKWFTMSTMPILTVAFATNTKHHSLSNDTLTVMVLYVSPFYRYLCGILTPFVGCWSVKISYDNECINTR